MIQAIFRNANGQALPEPMPQGYRIASLRFRIAKGSVANTPLADSRFLPPEAHRERCWLAYAEALNADHEGSANERGTFPAEYRTFFENRRTPGSDVVEFAQRWGLRPDDLALSLQLSESRWQQTGELAGLEPPQRLPLVPIDIARTVVGDVRVDYDPTEMTRSQARQALATRRRELEKGFTAQFQEIEDAATARGLRQIPPLHRSWDELLKVARRRVRRRKGWTWGTIAEADHVAARVAQETVRRLEEILNS